MIIYLPNSIYIFSLIINITLKGSIIILLALLILKAFTRLQPRQKSNIILIAILSFIFIPLFALLFNFINPLIDNILRINSEIINQPVNNFSLIQNGLIEIPNQLNLHNFINTNGMRNKGIDWSSLFIIIWIVGFIITFGNFIISKLLLYIFNKKITLKENKKIFDCMIILMKEMNIKKNVLLRITNSLFIPVTFSFISPVILLPEESLKWNKNKLKSILIHELNHIKNNDCLSRDITKIICCVFWFFPLIWLAFYLMREEQEKSCDESVLNFGFKSSYYAEQLLYLAKNNYQKPLISAIANPIIGTSKVENRIMNILNYNPLYKIKLSFLKLFILSFVFSIFLLVFIIFNFFRIETKNNLYKRIKANYIINEPTSINSFPINIQDSLKDLPLIWPLANGYSDVKYINKDNPADGISFYQKYQSYDFDIVVSVADGIIESIDYDSFLKKNNGDALTAASKEYTSKNDCTVKIKHKNGYSSVYSNINLFKKFQVNQKIYQGQAFAYTFSAWSMDESEYGSIFKFKLQKNNNYFDPIPYLKSFKYKIFVPNKY